MVNPSGLKKALVVALCTGLGFFIPLVHEGVNALIGFHGLRLDVPFFWIFYCLFFIDLPWIYLPAGAMTFSVYLWSGESPVFFGGLLLFQLLLLKGLQRRFFLDVYPMEVFFSFWLLLGSYVLVFLCFYPSWRAFSLGLASGGYEAVRSLPRFAQLFPDFFVFHLALAAYNALVGSLFLRGMLGITHFFRRIIG